MGGHFLSLRCCTSPIRRQWTTSRRVLNGEEWTLTAWTTQQCTPSSHTSRTKRSFSPWQFACFSPQSVLVLAGYRTMEAEVEVEVEHLLHLKRSPYSRGAMVRPRAPTPPIARHSQQHAQP